VQRAREQGRVLPGLPTRLALALALALALRPALLYLQITTTSLPSPLSLRCSSTRSAFTCHPVLDHASTLSSHPHLVRLLSSAPLLPRSIGDFRPHATPAALMLLLHCPFTRAVQSRLSNNVKLSARPQTTSEPPLGPIPGRARGPSQAGRCHAVLFHYDGAKVLPVPTTVPSVTLAES
jgi:hypothetical protein